MVAVWAPLSTALPSRPEDAKGHVNRLDVDWSRVDHIQAQARVGRLNHGGKIADLQGRGYKTVSRRAKQREVPNPDMEDMWSCKEETEQRMDHLGPHRVQTSDT